ncbi:MAG: cytidine deaminase [bacterium]|nr:cytidine deaminase [bacterium]
MGINEELFEEAKKISENSYSPYSNFPVGAACIFENGKKYKGVNVENVSYGLTLCAERNALSTAACAGEKTGLLAIAIYSPKQKMCVPCGACLQWMAEFRKNDKDVKIILEGEDNEIKEFSLKDFLPYSFKIQ